MTNLEVGCENKRYIDGFIINFWDKIFNFLSFISIFYIIKKIKKKEITSIFVEKWVLFNLFFSIISTVVLYNTKNYLLAITFSTYGVLRVFEVVVYQINVLLFHPYRANLKGILYRIKSPTRMVILLLHNYIELIFWFATIYISLNIFSGMPLVYQWSGYVKVSAFCFINNDLSFVTESGLSHTIAVIAGFEMIGGMIMTLISLARFIGLLPSVESYEKI